MGFLTENDSMACFEILEKFSSGLSLTVGFSRFFLNISGLFQGTKRAIPRNTLMFYMESFLAFCFELPYKIDSPEPCTWLMLNMFCPRVHKTVASFVQKVGLIWLKGDILLQLFKMQK